MSKCINTYILLFIYLFSRMRHALRTPLSPDLRVCGLLWLASFRKLKNVTQSFQASARYYNLSASSLPIRCRYFALRDARNDAIFFPRNIKTEAWRVSKSMNSHLKWDPEALRGLMGRDSPARPPIKFSASSISGSGFVATWLIWVAIYFSHRI